MEDFRIGAQLYSVRTLCQDIESFRKTLREVAAIGYKGVQVSGVGAFEPERIREACDANGLQIVCTHVPFAEITENTEFSIRKHNILGCAYPGLGSMPYHYYDDGVDSLREFIAEFNKAADTYALHGMNLLYHNHAHEFQRFPIAGKSKLAIEVLMEEITNDAQFELDTHWVQVGGGDPVKYLYGRSADVIHFKDLLGGRDNTSVIATVGKGNLDWDGIIKACRDTRVMWAMIEQDNAVDEDDPIGCFAYSYDFLMKKGCKA